MGTVAPVAQTNAQLFTDMATTFQAIDHSPSDLEATIAKSPSTEQVSTQSLTVQQPFLADLNTLGTQLAPATAELKAALPDINPAIEAGTKTLARTPVLNANLQQVMNALKNLSQAPGTNVAVNALTGTVNTLNPMVRYLGPYQTVCDDWNYFWTYLSEHISEATSFGFAQRALINFGNPTQPNNVGQQGATAPANGGGSTSLLTGGNEFLHAQPYGAAVDNQGNADCETGQRGYPLKLNHLDSAGPRPRHRHPHAGRPGPDVQGPRPRARRRDLQPQPDHRPPDRGHPREPMRLGRKSKKRRTGMSKFKAGLIGIVLIAVFSYLAYTKFANPFAHKYTIHAIFANANGLQPGSLVRIAGVNVGTVTVGRHRSRAASRPAPHRAPARRPT